MWNTLVQIGIYALTTFISYQMREQEAPTEAASLEDFDVPTASESRPIPVVFGTVRISGSNVVWYGDYKTEKVKKSGGKK